MTKDELEVIKSFIETFNTKEYPLNIIVKALDKQIPKEPTGEYCPICEEWFYNSEINQLIQYSYCPNCGQVLRWE